MPLNPAIGTNAVYPFDGAFGTVGTKQMIPIFNYGAINICTMGFGDSGVSYCANTGSLLGTAGILILLGPFLVSNVLEYPFLWVQNTF